MRRIPEHMTANARALRNGQADAERMVRRQLSRYRPRFTRQLVVGPYIVDIAGRTAKRAVEFDGSQHQGEPDYDDRRTAFLEGEGWTVLRFWNGDVFGNLEGVVTVILDRAAECLGGTHP